MTVPVVGRAAQFAQRDAFGGELFEQRQALDAGLALEPVEQPLASEVDAHPPQRTPPSGRSRQASGGGRRIQAVIVLGIDPGLANTGYGVVARRGGRLLALDGAS